MDIPNLKIQLSKASEEALQFFKKERKPEEPAIRFRIKK